MTQDKLGISGGDACYGVLFSDGFSCGDGRQLEISDGLHQAHKDDNLEKIYLMGSKRKGRQSDSGRSHRLPYMH